MPEDEQAPRFRVLCRRREATVLSSVSQLAEREVHALRVHIFECDGRLDDALGDLLSHFDVRTVQ